MNVRRIHQLMRRNFPSFVPAAIDWINVGELDGLNMERFGKLLNEHLPSDEVLVEVHRKVGALLPRNDATIYVREHMGQGEIRIADREFTSFVVVAVNGVAAAWSKTANPSFERTPDGAAQVKR